MEPPYGAALVTVRGRISVKCLLKEQKYISDTFRWAIYNGHLCVFAGMAVFSDIEKTEAAFRAAEFPLETPTGIVAT